MGKKLITISLIFIILLLLFFGVAYYVKTTPIPSLQIYNNATDYTVTYRPTPEFIAYLKSLKLFQPKSIFQTIFQKPRITIKFLPSPEKSSDSNSRPLYVSSVNVSSVIDSSGNYEVSISPVISPDIPQWRSQTVPYNSNNILLSSIVNELIKLDNPKMMKLQAAEKTATVLTPIVSNQKVYPFTIKIKNE